MMQLPSRLTGEQAQVFKLIGQDQATSEVIPTALNPRSEPTVDAVFVSGGKHSPQAISVSNGSLTLTAVLERGAWFRLAATGGLCLGVQWMRTLRCCCSTGRRALAMQCG
jgi:hypothetical protein